MLVTEVVKDNSPVGLNIYRTTNLSYGLRESHRESLLLCGHWPKTTLKHVCVLLFSMHALLNASYFIHLGLLSPKYVSHHPV